MASSNYRVTFEVGEKKIELNLASRKGALAVAEQLRKAEYSVTVELVKTIE